MKDKKEYKVSYNEALIKFKETETAIDNYKSSSREHQLSFASNAVTFAEVIYKTLFLFNSGAFVLLPTYYNIILHSNEDVDFEQVKGKVKAITPVPGGVGPMTIACLLKNTLECFKARYTSKPRLIVSSEI